MTQNILVIGGTGKTGGRVAQKLQALHHVLSIGSRNGSPAFDWNDPTSYARALKGMDRAYITYYPDLAVPGSREAIATLTDIALRAGLEKVVLLSGIGEKEAEACEDIVANSGLNFTLVRASWFSQNFSESFLLDPILAGHVALPMADAQIPFVDADDIAEVVTKVLLDDAYNGETIEVTGPEKLSFQDVVREIARVTQREIRFQPISIGEYTAEMKAANLPDDYIWLFSYLFTEVLGNPRNLEIANDVSKVLGRRATDFATFARKTAATGIWGEVKSEILI